MERDLKKQAMDVLVEAGIRNPLRLAELVQGVIRELELDLSGFRILTEAASGPYVVTPVIALLAGAERVTALTRTSRYATVEQVIAQTRALEALCGATARVEIVQERRPSVFSEADIVTNLGFVRPIDREFVHALKSTAVVPLMYEAWEFRADDLDLNACKEKGIRVVGTNEEFPGLDVFSYSGWLCLKMLFDAQIEVHKGSMIVLSRDKFGVTIEQALARCADRVRRVRNLHEVSASEWADACALVVADYLGGESILGSESVPAADELARMAPGLTIVQFAGQVDVDVLEANGLKVYPGVALGPHRMAFTFAALGPRPVVELQAAGLKVGELAAKTARGEEKEADKAWRGLMQPL